MAVKLDKTDIEIIRNLWDGRTPYQVVAEKVGVTTNTVRSRVNRMIDNGVLQIISLVDPTALEGYESAFVGFKVAILKIKEAVETISHLKGVVGASAVSGRFDIMAIVMFNKEHSYQKFIMEELQSVEGLLGVETFFAVGGEGFQLRYVL